MRNWTFDDTTALSKREGSEVWVHCYKDGRAIAHTTGNSWKWDQQAERWVPATEQDMKL